MNALFEPPRWPGGPQICPTANLPALESSKALTKFLDANSPNCTVIHQWQCNACGLWHAWAIASPPAGASSGTTRTQKHKESITEAFWKSPVALTVQHEPISIFRHTETPGEDKGVLRSIGGEK